MRTSNLKSIYSKKNKKTNIIQKSLLSETSIHKIKMLRKGISPIINGKPNKDFFKYIGNKQKEFEYTERELLSIIYWTTQYIKINQ